MSGTSGSKYGTIRAMYILLLVAYAECVCALHQPRRGVEGGAGFGSAHPHQTSGYMLPERERKREREGERESMAISGTVSGTSGSKYGTICAMYILLLVAYAE